MAKCKNCINLQNHWCDMVADSPDENAERECCTYECMTQGDRIRSMSDEELAEFLIKSDCCIANAGKVDCSQAEECGICEKVIRNWLKSEVEESDER